MGTPTPSDLILLHPGSTLGGYGRNILMHVQGHEHFIPTKFRKHPLSGSVVKADLYICSHTYTCISAIPLVSPK